MTNLNLLRFQGIFCDDNGVSMEKSEKKYIMCHVLSGLLVPVACMPMLSSARACCLRACGAVHALFRDVISVRSRLEGVSWHLCGA